MAQAHLTQAERLWEILEECGLQSLMTDGVLKLDVGSLLEISDEAAEANATIMNILYTLIHKLLAERKLREAYFVIIDKDYDQDAKITFDDIEKAFKHFFASTLGKFRKYMPLMSLADLGVKK